MNAVSQPEISAAADFPGVDLDMLAYDIADMLGRFGYPIDAADCHIRSALPAFLREVTADAAADDGDWEAEAMHSGGTRAGPGGSADLAPDAALRHQRGRAPRMACHPWLADQGVEVGAVTASEWYWRCPSAAPGQVPAVTAGSPSGPRWTTGTTRTTARPPDARRPARRPAACARR